MTMYRRPEDCRYRSPSNGPPGSKAICRLLASLTGVAEGELVQADLEAFLEREYFPLFREYLDI